MLLKPLLLSAFLAAGAMTAPSEARPHVEGRQQLFIPVQDRHEGRTQSIRSLREVVDDLRSQYGGDLISARLEEGPRPFYVLRWRMPDGQVRDFRVSAVR